MPIYLIRHGQSEFNAAYNGGDVDPMIFDAPLTKKGIGQAKAARAAVAALGIRHVIVSPFTRAIQTAQLIFESNLPLNIMAGPHEHLSHSCDVGRSPDALQKDFPHLSFAHLPDIWWHRGPVNENGIPVEPEGVFRRRIAEFAENLRQITVRPLAIVGHGNAFMELTGHQMENCEIRRHPE